MQRRRTLGLILLNALSITAVAQVPPGPPYSPELHPNPIVTFVRSEDFRRASYDEARTAAGTELLGISANEGSRRRIAVAPGRALEVRVVGRRTEVLTFPVVVQTFDLAPGGTLELYSFRNPRTNLPARDAEAMLNTEAFSTPRKPGEGRFGPESLPDTVSVRGRPALLFNTESGPVLFWQEDGISHVAVSTVEEEDLFRVVEDLL